MVTKEWVEKKVEPIKRRANLLRKVAIGARAGAWLAKTAGTIGVTYYTAKSTNHWEGGLVAGLFCWTGFTEIENAIGDAIGRVDRKADHLDYLAGQSIRDYYDHSIRNY